MQFSPAAETVANKCCRNCCLFFWVFITLLGAKKGHVLFSPVAFLQKAAAWNTQVCSLGSFSADTHTSPWPAGGIGDTDLSWIDFKLDCPWEAMGWDTSSGNVKARLYTSQMSSILSFLLTVPKRCLGSRMKPACDDWQSSNHRMGLRLRAAFVYFKSW